MRSLLPSSCYRRRSVIAAFLPGAGGRIILLGCGLLFFSSMGRAQTNPKAKLEVTAELSHAPGGMTITPSGNIVLSLHQFQQANERVVEITPEGEVKSFPTPDISLGTNKPILSLDAVLGVKTDKKGIVWMLDNGRRSETLPKLVAWNPKEKELVRVIYIPPPATIPSSFLNDIAVDPEKPFIYITDPADGQDAALIVVDLDTGLSRRVLQSHYSVQPQDIPFVIDGQAIEVLRPDGSMVKPFSGGNPIAVDGKGDWLYFGPMIGRSLYRVATRHLRDLSLKPVELASRVEGYSEKPICDGIAIDSKGNIFISDIVGKAIGIVDEKSRKYEIYVRHEQFLWPDGLCFGNDGRLYFFASQLQNTPTFSKGKDGTRPPFLIFKIKIP